MRQAKQKCQLVQQKRERDKEREREREIDRERGAATLQKLGNLQLREQHVPLQRLSLVSRVSLRRMESIEGQREREPVEPYLLSTGTTKGCPQTTSSQTVPVLLLPALAVLLTHCKASNNEAQTHLH